jgi:hypothetical protein
LAERLRRYERRAIEATIEIFREAVIATAGGVVSDTATFDLPLGHCTTVWLRTAPQDRMQRVMAQGDIRPIEAREEAMEDLRPMLAGREAFYAKADVCIDTSAQPQSETFLLLRAQVRAALGLAPWGTSAAHGDARKRAAPARATMCIGGLAVRHDEVLCYFGRAAGSPPEKEDLSCPTRRASTSRLLRSATGTGSSASTVR